MTVLIPAYKPDTHLLKLISEIQAKSGYNIVIVNDGSGEKFNNIFSTAEKLHCVVLRHVENQGKGCALKTGFEHIKNSNENEGVVCADCDGQHIVDDIIKVAEEIKNHKDFVIIGCRRFTGKVPFRSRFGNTVSRVLFTYATGTKVYDTQSGLRGYSPDMLDWLCSICGERYEYEINMLLEAQNNGYPIFEVNIETVYDKNNKSSHFRAIRDSSRVFFPILKFCASSLISALLDFSLLIIFQQFLSNLFISVVGARVCSSVFNYTMNGAYVFSKPRKAKVNQSAIKYFGLVIAIMLMNYGIIYTFNILLGIPLVFAKIFTEAVLFLFSYWAQRRFIF